MPQALVDDAWRPLIEALLRRRRDTEPAVTPSAIRFSTERCWWTSCSCCEAGSLEHAAAEHGLWLRDDVLAAPGALATPRRVHGSTLCCWRNSIGAATSISPALWSTVRHSARCPEEKLDRTLPIVRVPGRGAGSRR
jgi:hypothetical protein